jgi:hypothetical protein
VTDAVDSELGGEICACGKGRPAVEVMDTAVPQGFRIRIGTRPTLISITSVLLSQPDKLDPEDISTVTPGSPSNGALFKNNNFIWSGAMKLAWNQLLGNHSVGTTEITNLNKRPFSTLDLSPKSYYIKVAAALQPKPR